MKDCLFVYPLRLPRLRSRVGLRLSGTYPARLGPRLGRHRDDDFPMRRHRFPTTRFPDHFILAWNLLCAQRTHPKKHFEMQKCKIHVAYTIKSLILILSQFGQQCRAISTRLSRCADASTSNAHLSPKHVTFPALPRVALPLLRGPRSAPLTVAKRIANQLRCLPCMVQPRAIDS